MSSYSSSKYWFSLLGWFLLPVAALLGWYCANQASPSAGPVSPPPSNKTHSEPSSVDLAAMELELRSKINAEYEPQITQLKDALAYAEQEYKTSNYSLSKGDVTNLRQLNSGIPFHTNITQQSGDLASVERLKKDSYVAHYTLKINTPKPLQKVEEMEKQSLSILKMLPQFKDLLDKATVSPWYDILYVNKLKRISEEATSLNDVLTKHNLYDCDTILYLQAPNGRKMFFLQADMDVVSDGSDGDRLTQMPDEIVNSTYYQPFTSYSWKKKTTQVNPMIAGWEQRIKTASAELNNSNTTADRKKWLVERVAYLKRGIADMKHKSFLIADYDPFIVIPVPILLSKNSFSPQVGDYAVVISGDRIFPAIVGDGGPSFKAGEASLRLAKEINPKSSSYSRPVSDLSVSYLVFPGTAEAVKDAPNYEVWRERCEALLNEIGGLAQGYSLHQWENVLAAPATPIPSVITTPPSTKAPAVNTSPQKQPSKP